MVPSLTDADLRFLEDAREAETVTEGLTALVAEHYERKRTATGEPGIGVLERLVLLRVIDSLWVEHLTAIDDMRRGIGLRAYSQRDPLNEFKIEAYRMFDELKSTIRHDVTHTIFRVSVQQQHTHQRPVARNVVEGRAAAMGASTSSAAGASTATAVAGAAAPARSGPKIGRNDPCYCGSGKKFKKCHGA
jgi:preprotein translocase subunit SecA